MPELPPELQQIADELGIDPYQLVGGTSLPVYLGGGTPRFIRRRQPGTSTGPVADPDQAFQTVPAEQVETVEEDPESTSTVDELIQDLYRMDEGGLRELQASLEAGGYFRVAPDNIGWGRPDRATVDAYSSLLDEAAAYFQAGVRKPLDAILNEAVQSREEAVEPEQTEVVRRSDPAALTSLVRQVARQLLGGDLDPERTSQIVASIRDAEVSAQRQVIDAPEGSTVTVDDVDPAARVESLLRSEFPTEVAGMQGADGYRSFLSLLGPGGIG